MTLTFLRLCLTTVGESARRATGRATGRAFGQPEDGFTVAEHLAMGALGVVAIAALWVLMQALGVDVINAIRDNILGGGT